MMVGGSQYAGHQMGDPGAELSYLDSRERHHSMLDSIERRTQRTYRYGIGLVCIGATLNWLGFAQGNSYIDPLRYLGVACVISGSFCVCLAMCRWLGRPISVSGHRLEEESLGSRSSGDVHVINVAVPMYVPSMSEEYRPSKPPDYEIVAAEPPPYDEAIKLSPGILISLPSPSHSAHSMTPLLHDASRKASISSEIHPGSPPPPYHPSPARTHHSCNLNSSSSIISPTNDNCQMKAPHQAYHMSAEQEHLLGLMMRGQHQQQRSGDMSSSSNSNSESHLRIPLLTDGGDVFIHHSIPISNSSPPSTNNTTTTTSSFVLSSPTAITTTTSGSTTRNSEGGGGGVVCGNPINIDANGNHHQLHDSVIINSSSVILDLGTQTN